MLGRFFENFNIVLGGLDGTAAAGLVGLAGEALGVESMNRFVDRRIPCRRNRRNANALSRLQDHLGTTKDAAVLATVEFTR